MSANTIRSVQLSWFSLCVFCVLCGEYSSASAAPPAITSLSPPGAQRGTTTDVTAAGALDASTKVWASSKSVTVEVAKGKLKVTVAKDAAPGVYAIRAFNDDGASNLRPFIVGALPEVIEKEPNDDFKKPHVLDGSSFTINGKLEKVGDVDCFAVTLKKGQTLVAALDANRTLRAPMDAVLQVLSADGFVIEENNDFHGLDPQLAFTAKKDGTYIARVYAFPSMPDSSIRFFGSDACVYRLTLTTGAFADFAVPLAVSKDATQVEGEGWNLSPETRKLALAPGDDAFATAFGANVANSVRVRREPHKCYVGEKGEARSMRYDLPLSFTGTIEKKGGTAGIIPWLKKGQTVSIQVESRTLGLAVNPVLGIFDAELKPLAKAEPAKLNGDTALSFTPPADGFYALLVQDLYGGGGPRHAFLIRILTPEPDYSLTTTADRFTIVPGKPTTVAVKVTRVRGFTRPVEITAEGLPEGVKFEVTASAKPDPNTVTLSLTAEKPWAGSFRLTGKVKDEPGLTRTVRVSLPELDEPTADLWLTVTAPAKK